MTAVILGVLTWWNQWWNQWVKPDTFCVLRQATILEERRYGDTFVKENQIDGVWDNNSDCPNAWCFWEDESISGPRRRNLLLWFGTNGSTTGWSGSDECVWAKHAKNLHCDMALGQSSDYLKEIHTFNKMNLNMNQDLDVFGCIWWTISYHTGWWFGCHFLFSHILGF